MGSNIGSGLELSPHSFFPSLHDLADSGVVQSEASPDGREAVAMLHVSCPYNLIPLVVRLVLLVRKQYFERGPGQPPLRLRNFLHLLLARNEGFKPRHE